MANPSEAKLFAVCKESSKFLGTIVIHNFCSRLNPLCVSLNIRTFLPFTPRRDEVVRKLGRAGCSFFVVFRVELSVKTEENV